MNAAITGVGTSFFGKQPDLHPNELVWRAVSEALAEAGDPAIDAIYLGTVFGAPGVAQRALHHLGLSREAGHALGPLLCVGELVEHLFDRVSLAIVAKRFVDRALATLLDHLGKVIARPRIVQDRIVAAMHAEASLGLVRLPTFRADNWR